MLRALSLTFGQLGDRAIVRIMLKSLAVTASIFVIAGIGLVAAVSWLAHIYGWGDEGGKAATFVAGAGAVAGTWLLFRAVAVPVIGFFADEIVIAIEAKHYPDAARLAKPPSMAVSLRLGLGSLMRLIGFNLVALPLYVVLIFTAVGPVVAFVAVNALLLGRDLGEMVAVRHLDPAGLKGWLQTTRGTRAILGLIVTGLFLVPFLNLLAPVIGAGMATHLFHGRHD